MTRWIAALIFTIWVTGCATPMMQKYTYDDLSDMAVDVGAVELDSDDNGAIDIAKGGTNGETAAEARTNLDLEPGTDFYSMTAADAAFVALTGDQTVAGVKTFSSFPVSPSSAPTTDYQIPNKKYVDDQITAVGTHDAITLGTANGLSLSTQELSLAAATNSSAGAATAAQITALEAVLDWTQDQGGTNIHSGNYTDTTLSQEAIEDYIGAMLTGNTETNITVTYQDADGTIDFVATGGGGSGDLLADGTVPLTANWDVGAYTITGTQFISDIATGTAPFGVSSTTVVTNLNADTVDGESASAFEDADATLTDIADGTIAENLVNTANPWADNEVANDITITDASQISSLSANGESLIEAANYAAMRGLLDLEAGTDFYSTSAADAAFEGELDNEAGLYSALSDVSQFYEPGDTVQTNSSTSLPGTCTVGEIYVDTDADTDGSLYICVATDTWKEVDDDGATAGDITQVLGEASGSVDKLWQPWNTLNAADTTPIVNYSFMETADTTIFTDFDGSENGQVLFLYCAHAAGFDFSSSNLVAFNRTTDYTATVGEILIFIYYADNTKWYCLNVPPDTMTIQFAASAEFEGATADAYETTVTVTDPTADRTITIPDDSGTVLISGDTLTGDVTATFDTDGTTATTIAAGAVDKAHLAADAKFYSIAVADLSDATTPSVLTTSETTNTCISNYKASGADHVFTMCAAHAAGNVIFPIGDEFQVDIEPDTDDLFYLNGTAMAANEHIQNTADTLGQRIVGYCVNINGTLRWMFYSSDTDFVEETP